MVTITLQLASINQLLGLDAALETYVEMETEREKEDSGFTAADKARLAGAREVLNLINKGRK